MSMLPYSYTFMCWKTVIKVFRSALASLPSPPSLPLSTPLFSHTFTVWSGGISTKIHHLSIIEELHLGRAGEIEDRTGNEWHTPTLHIICHVQMTLPLFLPLVPYIGPHRQPSMRKVISYGMCVAHQIFDVHLILNSRTYHHLSIAGIYLEELSKCVPRPHPPEAFQGLAR